MLRLIYLFFLVLQVTTIVSAQQTARVTILKKTAIHDLSKLNSNENLLSGEIIQAQWIGAIDSVMKMSYHGEQYLFRYSSTTCKIQQYDTMQKEVKPIFLYVDKKNVISLKGGSNFAEDYKFRVFDTLGGYRFTLSKLELENFLVSNRIDDGYIVACIGAQMTIKYSLSDLRIIRETAVSINDSKTGKHFKIKFPGAVTPDSTMVDFFYRDKILPYSVLSDRNLLLMINDSLWEDSVTTVSIRYNNVIGQLSLLPTTNVWESYGNRIFFFFIILFSAIGTYLVVRYNKTPGFKKISLFFKRNPFIRKNDSLVEQVNRLQHDIETVNKNTEKVLKLFPTGFQFQEVNGILEIIQKPLDDNDLTEKCNQTSVNNSAVFSDDSCKTEFFKFKNDTEQVLNICEEMLTKVQGLSFGVLPILLRFSLAPVRQTMHDIENLMNGKYSSVTFLSPENISSNTLNITTEIIEDFRRGLRNSFIIPNVEALYISLQSIYHASQVHAYVKTNIEDIAIIEALRRNEKKLRELIKDSLNIESASIELYSKFINNDYTKPPTIISCTDLFSGTILEIKQWAFFETGNLFQNRFAEISISE